MAITPERMYEYTEPVTDAYRRLEDVLFILIAQHLKTDEDIDDVFQWQSEKISRLQSLDRQAIKELSKTTGIAEPLIRQAIEYTANETIRTIDDQVKVVFDRASSEWITEFIVLASMSGVFTPPPKPDNFNFAVRQQINRTFREFNVFINETLITTTYGEGAVARMYRRIIEETIGRVMSGRETVQEAVSDTVIRWSQRGISSGFVDRGGRAWSLERYAESTIRSTVNNTYNEFTIERMRQYGTDLVLVSSLPDPREACSYIQGRVASLSYPSSNPKYPSVYDFGYGEPWGLRGVNCRHRFYAWFEGISENNQIQYDIDEAQERYKLSQQQRHYERQIRKAKRALNIAKVFGDEELIKRYNNLIRTRQAKVREFVSKHNLPRRYDRERLII